MDCELCKQNFPFKITYKNQIIDVVTVEHPKTNYIIFESLTSQENTKTFYIVNTADELPIKIGRGQDSQVRVTDDISVSRAHAIVSRGPDG